MSMLRGQTKNIGNKLLKVYWRDVVKIQSATNFWEADKKGGYKTKIKGQTIVDIKEGLGEIKVETTKWKEEMKSKWSCDNFVNLEHNDYEIIYKFNNKNSIKDWIVTTDKDHNEGKTKAEFYLGPNKRGIFKGIVNTEVPKDGVTQGAGYANIRGPKAMRSFKREQPFDWEEYTHLIMHVRGDGRPYQVVLGMDRYYDVQWNDQYNYPLYTRGGPYWQYVKIPFSKFFLSAKGRIQDKQNKLQLNKVSWVGLTLSDGWNGPFQLEIDWIGVVLDENHTEQFAYEMYQIGSSEIG